MDLDRLIERLRAVEQLHAGATTPGEEAAADAARRRLLKRLASAAAKEAPVEYKFTFSNPWSRRLFVALARRYNLEPFRYKRQRRTTVMLRVPPSFADETLWPEFEALNDTLVTWLCEAADRVIAEALETESGEAEAVDKPAQLGIQR